GVPDVPGTSLEIFSIIAAQKIAVDMMVQSAGREGRADVSFTVRSTDLKPTLKALLPVIDEIGADGITHDDSVSKVSVVGLGMAEQFSVASRMFRALANAEINIEMITTSEIKISALVPRDSAGAALRSVHGAFGLDQEPQDAKTWPQIRDGREETGADVETLVSRLRDDALEAVTLTGIQDTKDQAVVTLYGVPDKPGIAAEMFESIGKAEIFVDMIVQGADGDDGQTSISFTVDSDSLEDSLAVANQLRDSYALRLVDSRDNIAKLTVSGIGLRSHTSVGTIMFRCLANAEINVQLIGTSELQVNAVVDGDSAQSGLQHLERAFADSTDA
ncbi:MAG: ACT domain-containing protein, partial [Planctomycetota bacterium]